MHDRRMAMAPTANPTPSTTREHASSTSVASKKATTQSMTERQSASTSEHTHDDSRDTNQQRATQINAAAPLNVAASPTGTVLAHTPSPARGPELFSSSLLPPHNLEAEESVLGSILLDRDALVQVSDILRADHFYKQAHAIIYEAMMSLEAQSQPIDVVSLSNSLQEKGTLKRIGGRAALVSLASSVPSAANVKHYALIVIRKATLRSLIRASAEISELARQEEQDTSAILDQAEQKLFSISQSSVKQGFTAIKDVLGTAFDRIDQLQNNQGALRGVPTGFRDLDELLSGLQKSDLLVLAARPAMGKTSFALNIAAHAGVHANVPTAIFSLEMSKEQLVDRMLAAEAGVDLWRLRAGKLSDAPESNDFAKIGQAMGALSEAKIYIDDTPLLNIMELRTKARRLKAEHGLGLVIIDYLQLMTGHRVSSSDNRVQEVSEISRGLKGIARELDVPVLALSQLSRAVENRSPQIPMLADLRESGSIEQDADIVMFIYREEVYKKDTERKNIAEIHVRKHRNGPIGQVDLFFSQQNTQFRNLETSHAQAAEMMP